MKHSDQLPTAIFHPIIWLKAFSELWSWRLFVHCVRWFGPILSPARRSQSARDLTVTAPSLNIKFSLCVKTQCSKHSITTWEHLHMCTRSCVTELRNEREHWAPEKTRADPWWLVLTQMCVWVCVSLNVCVWYKKHNAPVDHSQSG